MSYLVLARKKRPQVFEDVIGQRPITQTLQNAISQNRVAHAFLFTGPRGVGKTSTARILAKALNCEKGPQTNPCNQCATCREVSDGNSIDVIEIDGASNRGIDEVRELRENVRYTPAKSRYKVFIIDEVHMLTLPAFNALLKTLEEPPSHIIFIFATTEPHKIPATILSRCQRYDFKRIPVAEIVQHLRRIVDEEKIEINPRGLYTVARESEGSMRDAQSLLDRLISYGGTRIREDEINEVLGLIGQKMLSDTIEAIADHDASRCFETVDQVYQFGYDIQHFCQELLQYLRNLILLKVSSRPEPFLELPGEEIEALKRQAERFQFDQLNHLFGLLLKGEEAVAQSTFPRTMLEMTLIRMATVHSVLPIDEIMKKLEDLERAMPARRKEPAEPPPTRKMTVPKVEQKKADRAEIVRTVKDEAPPPMMPPLPKVEQKEEKGKESIQAVNGETPFPDPEEKEIQVKEPSDEGMQAGSEEVWRGLIDFVRARKPSLGSVLVLGGLVQLSDEKIEIGFERDSFHYETMIERENRGQLEQLCRDFLKREVKVLISSFEGEGMPRGRMNSRKRETTPPGEKEVPSEKEIKEDPVIQEVLRLFDGRIVKG
jgi:DNA polymerase III subunit gamma/tau